MFHSSVSRFTIPSQAGIWFQLAERDLVLRGDPLPCLFAVNVLQPPVGVRHPRPVDDIDVTHAWALGVV